MEFKPLSIYDGVGRVHINRFRICVRAPADRGRVAAIGARLLENMPQYMAANTASVRFDRPWNGSSTLKFRGVARIQPFVVPIPSGIPGVLIPTPAPEKLRDGLAPDLHTDSVGVVRRGPTGFTVQTLKREFEDDNDRQIRQLIRAGGSTLSVLLGLSVVGVGLTEVLASHAVYYNQHHFLAGRRAFRFGWGGAFGYGDDRAVFETVAIERFSSVVFEKSQLVMGSFAQMIRNVWGEMLTRFCQVSNLHPIQGEAPPPGWRGWGNAVKYLQMQVAENAAAIQGNNQWGDMSRSHQDLLERR
jgi:hypothetical protein